MEKVYQISNGTPFIKIKPIDDGRNIRGSKGKYHKIVFDKIKGGLDDKN